MVQWIKKIFGFVTSQKCGFRERMGKTAFYEHYRDVPDNDWHWPDFTPKEIACQGTGELLVDYHAMDCLQTFRDLIKNPVIINSAYRSESHNKAVGGVKGSQHRKGKAFDIRLTPKTPRHLIHKYATKAGFTGFGDYTTFVHIDTGQKRSWDYR